MDSKKRSDGVVYETVKAINDILNAGVVNGKVVEELKSLGTFIGMLTSVLDIPILASTADLEGMLADAMARKDSKRICLMVVLITHLLEYCNWSIISQEDCARVSRLIALLKEVHEADGTNVFVCLEIERYLENLDNPTPTIPTNFQSSSEESLMNELANANDWEEVQYHAYEYSSPPREYTPQYYDEIQQFSPPPHYFPPIPPSYHSSVFFYVPVYFCYLL